MAMAALRHEARRLSCQRPPAIFRAAVAEEQRRLSPRLIHGCPPAVGRTFSLAEEQRRLLPRLIHGGTPAVRQTYSRQFSSFHRGKPKPNRRKSKETLKVYVDFVEHLKQASMQVLKLSCFGVAIVLLWKDLSGPRHVPRITRIMLGPDPLEERVPGGGQESEAESESSS